MKNIVSVKDLKKIIFAIPSLSIQKQITQKLDHVLGELDTKKKEIISLIEQNKERIDFFEKNWMSYVIEREIEKHPKRKEWELKKISQVCNVNPSKSEIKDLPDDTLVSFIPMLSIEAQDTHRDPLVIILRAFQPITSITLRGVLLVKNK